MMPIESISPSIFRDASPLSVSAALIVSLLLTMITSVAGSPESPWSVVDLEHPPVTYPAPEVSAEEGMRAFYYDGLPLNGKPSRIFALYAAPDSATAANKAPGIVLVHGGGGTAFASWVRLWRDRGYAAIALDHDGGIPIGKTGAWRAAPQGGPRFQGVDQVSQPVADQWMYHAVAGTILAHSLLRSFPEVDANRIGITGISWGGVITATVAGLDPRFKFAVPVYGCGYVSDPPSVPDDGSCFVGNIAPPSLRARWRQLWDPANYLSHAGIPMLWVTGTNDFAFTLAALRRSIHAAPGPHVLSVHPRMPHGHGGPGESPEEIHAFADSIVKDGLPLIRILRDGRDDAGDVWVEYDAPDSVQPQSAQLLVTHGLGLWQNRWWNIVPATIIPTHRRVSARLPRSGSYYFFNIIDTRGLVTSSPLASYPPF